MLFYFIIIENKKKEIVFISKIKLPLHRIKGVTFNSSIRII